MTSPAPVQLRYIILRVPRDQPRPSVGEKLNPNHFDAMGDSFDELSIAHDQAQDIQDLEKDGGTIIVCDSSNWTRAA